MNLLDIEEIFSPQTKMSFSYDMVKASSISNMLLLNEHISRIATKEEENLVKLLGGETVINLHGLSKRILVDQSKFCNI